MHIEIEAKIKVDSLTKVARCLKKLGAEFLRGRLHTDTYFDDARATLRKSDSALRIRRRLIGKKEQFAITFKGPRQKGRFKQRREIQFEVADADSAEMLLVSLGYKKSLVFQKKRCLWRLDGCEVALDTLPLLGNFVEIEGPSENKIAAVQKTLGLADLPHIADSYAVLMQRKLRKLKRTKKEVFF